MEQKWPPNIPSNPERVCQHDGWQGWRHWLGTGNQKTKVFLPFEQAHAHALLLKLKRVREWQRWSKSGARRANIPSSPDQVYEHDGWQGWDHWLGTGNQKTKAFLPFDQAHAHALSLTRKGEKEWEVWPTNIPSCPNEVYKHDGWQGWDQWLGTGNQKTSAKAFLPFDQAHACARFLTLKSQKEWEAWSKSGARPANVPSNPDVIHKLDGWQGWGHGLLAGQQQPEDKGVPAV